MFLNHRLDDVLFWLKLAGGVIAAWFISWPELLQILAILQLVDIATGIAVAAQDKSVRSETAYRGVLKKAFAWVIIMVVWLLQDQMQHYFPVVVAGLTPFELAAAIFAVAESISILENAEAAGVPIPRFLSDALATAQAQMDSKAKEQAEDEQNDA